MLTFDTKQPLETVTISPNASISEALLLLDTAGTGALALCTPDRRLCGFLTDGDVRRAILQSTPLTEACLTVANRNPIVAVAPISSAEALELINRHNIDHLPVVDSDGALLELLLRQDLVVDERPEWAARARLRDAMVSPTVSISGAIASLEKAGTGALILSLDGRTLFGLLTDGDLRRAVLQGKLFDEPCGDISSRDPVTADPSIAAVDALRLMNERDINHLPLVDSAGTVVGLLLRKDVSQENPASFSAVIMAGGYGKRLRPLTENLPKPMLPVGNRPLLELMIEQLRRSGVREINLTTHYLPNSITDHFGDGQTYGVRLNYFKEEHPMGTAGGLKQMRRPDGPVLVINGDILTGVSFQSMLRYHRKHQATITIGVRQYDVRVPFGVIECAQERVTSLREKPSLKFFINAGTYLLDPIAFDYIPDGQRFDMTDLIERVLEIGKPVVSFPIVEYWLDVGRHEDYKRAQEDVKNGRI
jgi:dTDP-glucose pyrophosphorylase/CBS domain-containing protein